MNHIVVLSVATIVKKKIKKKTFCTNSRSRKLQKLKDNTKLKFFYQNRAKSQKESIVLENHSFRVLVYYLLNHPHQHQLTQGTRIWSGKATSGKCPAVPRTNFFYYSTSPSTLPAPQRGDGWDPPSKHSLARWLRLTSK